MNNFAIVTDSCCDLPYSVIKDKKIPFVSLTVSYNGEEYIDDFGETLTSKKFFNDMRNGALPDTSQPNSEDYIKVFEELLKEGKDIIYISVSSGLSGTFNSARIGKEMMVEKYPDRRIYLFDTLTASICQGIIVLKAYEMREEGKTFEDVIDYLEMNVFNYNTYMTVDDLGHLKRSGRISVAAATVGMLLHLKPILTLNNDGKVMPVVKIRGRKKTIKKLADIVVERIKNSEEQTIAISHGDCLSEALKLKEIILAKVEVKNVIVSEIGPVVGRFGGPGALAVFFKGAERQNHIIERLDHINEEK
ncbi:DegV family protein [Clostridium sp. DL1XJH146]